MFIRSLKESQIVAMKKDKLFTDKLMKDIKAGVIFPAIRKDEIHFYYNGSSLFVYAKKSFKYNKKYWCGIKAKGGKVTEKTLGISFFEEYEALKRKRDDYEKVKQNRPLYEEGKKFCGDSEEWKKFCDNYENKKDSDEEGERELLDKLYRHTFLETSDSNIVILDAEFYFPGDSRKGDLLLMNKDTAELFVIEGKLFENGEMYQKNDKDIQIIDQLNAYDSIIAKDNANILKQYEEYVTIINELFDPSLPTPKSLRKYTKLLVLQCKTKYPKGQEEKLEKRQKAAKEIDSLRTNKVLWCNQSEKPSLDEIYNRTNEYTDLL